MDYLKAKVDAGADYLCTQAFFDNHDFHDFRDRCALAGIRVPVLAGLLPLTSPALMTRMAELAGGARYPARLLRTLRRTGALDGVAGGAGHDPAGGAAEAFRRVALHHAAEQCADLLDHDVAGVHFYTLNQSRPVLEVLQRIGWQR